MVSSTRFSVTQDGKSLELPYYSNHPLGTPNNNIERLIVVIHGGDIIPRQYLQSAEAAAGLVGTDAKTESLIVSLEIASLSNLTAFFAGTTVPPQIMFRNDNGGTSDWYPRFGEKSSNNDVKISYFTALDQLFAHVCTSDFFPNLQRIVIVGQSAGGQFVNRYAACSVFEYTGIAIRYITLNPSSYLYFDNTRWIPGTNYAFDVPTNTIRDSISNCQTRPGRFAVYNSYGYGLDSLDYAYHQRNDVVKEAVLDRYSRRNVVHLVGANDNNPSDPSLGTVCQQMLQGNHRVERGQIYAAHLKSVFGDRNNHHFEFIPGVGHNGRAMIQSNRGREIIFEKFEEPAMKTLADYLLVRDSFFTIRDRENREFNIELPNDAVLSGFSKRPILAFFADPRGDANNLALKVDMNGAEIAGYTYSAGNGRGHWEAFTHDHLRVGETNTIRFRIIGGTGGIRISDVVLWYQRNVW